MEITILSAVLGINLATGACALRVKIYCCECLLH